MGLLHETEGDNDFASIFQSVAEERRVKQEREQADLLLRILDELEERERAPPKPRGGVEYLRVAPNGDVIHDKVDEEKRHRVMTVDQLPKESEYEMLFGKPPEDPQLKVETGMRLRDGKPSQRVKLDELLLFNLPSFLRFEHFMVLAASLFLVFVLLRRYFRLRGERRYREAVLARRQEAYEAHLQLQHQSVEAEVERRVRERLGVLFEHANKNMCQKKV